MSLWAPHLFELEFLDAQGQPVPRTQRQFLDRTIVLGTAPLQELAPGESLFALLRPSQFTVPMGHELSAGNYQARVRYRGLTDAEKERIRAYSPDRPILRTWSHAVVSELTALKLINSIPQPKADELVWGETVNGLQAAIEYQVPEQIPASPLVAPGVPVGTPIGVVFHLRNVSDHSISFVSETGRQGDLATVIGANGPVQLKDVWFSGEPVDVEWTLLPGETARLQVLAPAINSIREPGEYQLTYTVRFNSRIQKDNNGQVVFPRPGDYADEIQTGTIPLVIAEPSAEVAEHGEIRGRVVDEAGNGVADVVVACGALIRDDGGQGGTRAATKADGSFRLLVPSPGLYNVWVREFPGKELTAAADDGVVVQARKVTVSQLQLLKGRRISGLVLRNDGSPVPLMTVMCYSQARPQSGGPQSTKTNADGSFEFHLPPGRSHLYVNGRTPATADNPRGKAVGADVHVEVPATGELSGIRLVLGTSVYRLGDPEWLHRTTPGTEVILHSNEDNVTGVVVDQNGQPISGALVFQEDGAQVRTDDEGRFV
ncbi:MAG: hypothetical protein KDA85_20415, partial [Planctomycetaceae bacterium]|nr:hypothetical protein [Planctomycetaceae bacterium]